MTHNDLIQLIERECLRRDIAPATFCRLAVGNNRLYRNLKAGKTCTIAIAEAVKAYARETRRKRK